MKLRTLMVCCGMVLSQAIVFGQTASKKPVSISSTASQPAGDAASQQGQAPGIESLAAAEELNRRASLALTQGDLPRSEQYFRQTLEIEQKIAPNGLAMARSLNGLGDVADKYGDVTKADEFYGKAFLIAQRIDAEGVDAAHSLHGQGMAAYNRGNLAKAEELFLQALAICQKRAPGGLEVAQNLDDLALVNFRRGRMSKAQELYQQALAIRENLAPGSLDVMVSLNHLGSLAASTINIDKAEEYYREAVAVEEHLPPNRLEHAMLLMGLSSQAFGRSEFLKAETYLSESLEIQEELVPESLTVAKTLSRLSQNARIRGDLGKAEQYERRALSIRQKRIPDSLDLAASLNSLGNIASRRGDLATAEGYQQKALKIRETLNPGSPELLYSFWSLGAIYSRRGDHRKAHEFYLEALAIAQKVDPDGPLVAACQSTLSSMALSEGDLIKAEVSQRHALEILQKLSPGSGEAAQSLVALGSIAERRGEAAKAQEYWRQALAIWERVAPGSMEHTELLATLARTTRETQQPEVSAQLYEQTLTALENQITHLGGGDEIRSDFRARHNGYYKEYIDLLMSQKQPEQAFQVLERSRSRALLELLTLAKVEVQQGVDLSLLKQQRALRGALAAKTSARIQLLGHKHTEDQLASIDKEIADLLAQGHQVEAQIAADSPRYGALTRPRLLSAAEVQEQLLDSDTLLLEYSLGEKRSYVFAVSAASVISYQLPPRAEIEKAARRVYDLVTAQNSLVNHETEPQKKARLMKAQAEYTKAAATLSELVLGPLALKLEHKRLLIVSDGALEYIPFAALPAPGPKASKTTPLVLDHEIIHLPSASVLAVLRQQEMGREPAPKAVAVLADPVFDKRDDRVAWRKPGPYVAQAEAKKKRLLPPNRSWAVADGELHLPRLPFSRREAQAIMAVTPAPGRMQALDFQANRTLAIGPELGRYRIVHFATHGLLDSDHPELSGLVLSMVDEQGKPQNGFLELQDIYNLNLRAELVVLSSCETGLGKQINGEGMLGLTRGFMYAGASRVVASLWKVSDIATAKLMASFYKAMEQQKARPAAALRAAQIEMWRQGRWRYPYFWAAFQIQGEWR